MRGDYVIYKRDRFIMTEERVLNAIAAEGLAPSKTGLADFYLSARGGACRESRKCLPSPDLKSTVLFPLPKKIGGLPIANRVVVTGAGIVTALGAGWKINAAGFRPDERRFVR